MRVSLPTNTKPCPSLANTLPAAHPNFNKKSAVIGGSPTLPLIPSVPKYFLAILTVLIIQIIQKHALQ